MAGRGAGVPPGQAGSPVRPQTGPASRRAQPGRAFHGSALLFALRLLSRPVGVPPLAKRGDARGPDGQPQSLRPRPGIPVRRAVAHPSLHRRASVPAAGRVRQSRPGVSSNALPGLPEGGSDERPQGIPPAALTPQDFKSIMAVTTALIVMWSRMGAARPPLRTRAHPRTTPYTNTIGM